MAALSDEKKTVVVGTEADLQDPPELSKVAVDLGLYMTEAGTVLTYHALVSLFSGKKGTEIRAALSQLRPMLKDLATCYAEAQGIQTANLRQMKTLLAQFSQDASQVYIVAPIHNPQITPPLISVTRTFSQICPTSVKVLSAALGGRTINLQRAYIANFADKAIGSLPSFNPRYYTRAPDSEFGRWAMGLVGQFPEDQGIVDELVEVYRKYVFCSGTPSGQIGRYTAVQAIRKRFQLSPEFSGITMQSFPQLHNILPVLPPSKINRQPKALFTCDLLELVREIGQLRVSLGSQSGPFYPADLKKRDTLAADFLMTAMLLADLGNTDFGADDSSKAFWAKWNYSRLCCLKNKEEVYPLSGLLTKTRNIHVQDSFAEWPAALLTQAVFGDHVLPSQSNSSVCLLGFSPFNGGMSSLIETTRARLAAGANYCYYIYADNLYVAIKSTGGFHWLSLDGAKMEASVRERDFKTLASLITDWLKASGYKIPLSLGNYLYHYWPTISIQSIAVIGKQQLVTGYMSSGTVGTAYANTVCTGRLATSLDGFARAGKTIIGDWHGQQMPPDWNPRPSDDDVPISDDLCDAGQSSFKLEAHTFIPDVMGVSTTYRLDLLGFDGLFTNAFTPTPMLVPVLNRDRLLKSCAFLRHDSSGPNDPSARRALDYVQKLAKYSAMYSLGAWQWMTLTTTIQQLSEKTQAFLAKEVAGSDDETRVEDFQSMAENLSDLAGIPFEQCEALIASVISDPIMDMASLGLLLTGSAELHPTILSRSGMLTIPSVTADELEVALQAPPSLSFLKSLYHRIKRGKLRAPKDATPEEKERFEAVSQELIQAVEKGRAAQAVAPQEIWADVDEDEKMDFSKPLDLSPAFKLQEDQIQVLTGQKKTVGPKRLPAAPRVNVIEAALQTEAAVTVSNSEPRSKGASSKERQGAMESAVSTGAGYALNTDVPPPPAAATGKKKAGKPDPSTLVRTKALSGSVPIVQMLGAMEKAGKARGFIREGVYAFVAKGNPKDPVPVLAGLFATAAAGHYTKDQVFNALKNCQYHWFELVPTIDQLMKFHPRSRPEPEHKEKAPAHLGPAQPRLRRRDRRLAYVAAAGREEELPPLDDDFIDGQDAVDEFEQEMAQYSDDRDELPASDRFSRS